MYASFFSVLIIPNTFEIQQLNRKKDVQVTYKCDLKYTMFFSAVTSSSCLSRINIVKSTQTPFGHSKPVTELFTETLDNRVKNML